MDGEKVRRPVRPERLEPAEIAPLPAVQGLPSEHASTAYSRFRSGLSRLRTGLSEHRTDLSEYRTDLSTERTELSMRRTGMSFHRTRMSAERTLMSVMRTSLSLIGFGFTIAQVFQKLHEAGTLQSSSVAVDFGSTLVLLGIAMLAVGITYHVSFMLELRRTRASMAELGLVHAETHFPVSLTLVVTLLLLLIGLLAIAGLTLDVGPFR